MQQPFRVGDECFTGLDGVRGDLVDRGQRVRERILQWIVVPCGIGIGAKSLAKLANHVAKSADRKPGSYPSELARVCNLAALSPAALHSVLAATEIGAVWGVGPKNAAKLQALGITTVADLVQMDRVVAACASRSCWNAPCVSYGARSASHSRMFRPTRRKLPARADSVAPSPSFRR